MIEHKFAIGDRVHLNLERHVEGNRTDMYTISRTLPTEANVRQYRVKRVSDGQERTVTESQLIAAGGDAQRTQF